MLLKITVNICFIISWRNWKQIAIISSANDIEFTSSVLNKVNFLNIFGLWTAALVMSANRHIACPLFTCFDLIAFDDVIVFFIRQMFIYVTVNALTNPKQLIFWKGGNTGILLVMFLAVNINKNWLVNIFWTSLYFTYWLFV